MVDQRTRYLRQVRRLRRGARRWSALAGTLGGAAAVLTPYHGVGLPDAAWAAAAGGSAVLALWRWSDLRALTRQPPPPAESPEQVQARLIATVERLPAGRLAVGEVRRQRARLALRGSAAAGPWLRLDRAAQALSGLADRLDAAAHEILAEAAVAEGSLRDLARRVAEIERAVKIAPEESRESLAAAHARLLGQLDGGVSAYERLVVAAAGYVAEDANPVGDHPSVSRLTEASDFLHGVAAGLAEFRSGGERTRTAH
ncbi:hypothetical protein [Plantactinospora sp. KBS50]|uniref:phage shock envelope stress response protein PspM n=1 Tax=Plantactinospora sp. KBS50 TaxID=2024580 RepID=UPI000BAACAE4|nr:hypothetical protein [Plantactinospora sp. KBS50]ASW54098.1 hypothetical protein CIK06_07700 [Plantactinospora sp. KBS50]